MTPLRCVPIARIRSDFSDKFGIPRQSGIVAELEAAVVFEPDYRTPDALRGLEGFSHLWLIWQFSEVRRDGWTATVRPPRLGGNTRMGVFATRSPYRPNPIGLSSVRLERIVPDTPEGTVLLVRGADLMDGTPILDIKPYLAYTDSHPDASGGFISGLPDAPLSVECAPEQLSRIPPAKREALLHVLSLDPRPHYQQDPHRIYGMTFAGFAVHFRVQDGVLTVTDIQPKK